MSIQNPGDIKFGDEYENNSQWWEQILVGTSKETLLQINSLRGVFRQHGEGQQWRYEAAGRDVLPIILAPPGTKFRYVDETYRYDGIAHKNQVGPDIADPFVRAGAIINLEKPWEQAYAEGNQKLTFADNTRIDLVGSKLQDEELIVDIPDVIFTNPYSLHGGESLIMLKTHGLFVFEGSADDRRPSLQFFREIQHEDLGFELVQYRYIDNLKIPLCGSGTRLGDGHNSHLYVYHKTRDFSPRERDLLRIDTQTADLERTMEVLIESYAGRFRAATTTARLEMELRKSVNRYARILNDTDGGSADLIHRSRTEIISKYADAITIPRAVHVPTYMRSNMEPYFRGLQRAQDIFWEEMVNLT